MMKHVVSWIAVAFLATGCKDSAPSSSAPEKTALPKVTTPSAPAAVTRPPAPAPATADDVVESWVKAFGSKDHAALSKLMRFPFTLNEGGKATVIDTPEALPTALQRFDESGLIANDFGNAAFSIEPLVSEDFREYNTSILELGTTATIVSGFVTGDGATHELLAGVNGGKLVVLFFKTSVVE
jgi:hypothetical protein